MKLTHFALILTLGLLGITGWFAWNEHTSAKSVRNQLDLYERHQPEPVLQAQEDQMLLDQMRKNQKAGAAPAPSPMPTALPSVAYASAPAPAHVTPPPLASSPHVSAA